MKRSVRGLPLAAAIAISLAAALPALATGLPMPEPPTVLSESATPTVDGVTFTAEVNTHGQPISAYFEWGDSEYDIYLGSLPAVEGQKGDARESVGGVSTWHTFAASDANQTFSYSVPYAFDAGFYLRWPDGLTWLYTESHAANAHDATDWRWERPSPTETLHYRVVLSGGAVDGADETVSSPAPTRAPSVSTGPARGVKKAKETWVYLTGTINEHAQGYAFYAFEWGTTKAYGHICAPVGAPPYWQRGFVWIPTNSDEHHVVEPCVESSRPQDQAPQGSTIHYRLVADNGYGSSPVYGKESTFTIPGGKSTQSSGHHKSGHHKSRHGKKGRHQTHKHRRRRG